MGAAGLQLAGQQRGDRLAVTAVESFRNLPMRHGLPAKFADRHLLPRMRMAVDRRIHGAALAVRKPPGKRPIAAPHRAGAAVVGELRGQRLVGAVVLGRHHQPGGVLVEPVHDARPLYPADAGKAAAAMRDQRVDQRAGLMARGGMHHKALGLVDDDDVVVLVDDFERDGLAFGLGGDRFRHVDCDRIAFCDVISGVADGGACDRDVSGEDQRLQPRPRQFAAARAASTRSSRTKPSSPSTMTSSL